MMMDGIARVSRLYFTIQPVNIMLSISIISYSQVKNSLWEKVKLHSKLGVPPSFIVMDAIRQQNLWRQASFIKSLAKI